MKVHRLVLMVIDFDDLGSDQVRDVLENARYPNRCIAPAVMEMQTADIGEWSDDHPLNSSKTYVAEFARLFPADVAVGIVARSER